MNNKLKEIYLRHDSNGVWSFHLLEGDSHSTNNSDAVWELLWVSEEGQMTFL